MTDEEYYCGKYLTTSNTIPYNENLNTQLVYGNEALKKEIKVRDCKVEINLYKRPPMELKKGKEDKNGTIEKKKIVNEKAELVDENITLKIVGNSMDNPNVVEDLMKENARLNLRIKNIEGTLKERKDTIKELLKPNDKNEFDEHIWGLIVNNNLVKQVK